MNLEFDYFTSITCGLFISSLILVICRLISYPITGVILAIVLSSLLAAFLYNPSKKKAVNHRTIRATGASVLFSLIFGIIFIIYYIPRFNGLLNGDYSLSISILIVLAIVIIGGIILGSIGGSIGSTFRDVFSIIKREN